MKNLILGLALVAAAACASQEKTNATGDASAPGAACGTECSGEKKEGCCADKAKAECSGEQKVCPATGKTIN
ncbi:MAG: hypothetical protein IT454_19045 [Planctomycetes bacterium]|nr:hypothetical protein [Planctomycetota bacterium]